MLFRWDINASPISYWVFMSMFINDEIKPIESSSTVSYTSVMPLFTDLDWYPLDLLLLRSHLLGTITGQRAIHRTDRAALWIKWSTTAPSILSHPARCNSSSPSSWKQYTSSSASSSITTYSSESSSLSTTMLWSYLSFDLVVTTCFWFPTGPSGCFYSKSHSVF